MLPPRHRGVVVCDTRRAAQWRRAFLEAGIEAVVVETDAAEAAAGACKVAVPESRLIEANGIVTEVTSGARSLPDDGVGWRPIVALLLSVALIIAYLAR